MSVSPDGQAGPLDGLVVVDFSRIVSGPFATQILGDLGADVIKVERLDTGDEVRSYGVDDVERMPGATFLAMNRNKRSICLDVRTPRGREVARRLLVACDIALHNFRVGVMERLGLGYHEVAAENARLIYCSISGFGTVGPLRESPANDLAIQAHTGLLSITGTPSGEPVRNPTPVSDMTAGLYAVIGILAALNHRHQTGVGQHVETNMYEGQLNMLNYMFIDYWVNGVVPRKMGTGNRMGLPNQAFPTSDGWICLVAASEPIWARCCDALGVPDLATDPRFRSLKDRYANREALERELSKVTSRFTTAECLDRLHTARVASAPVNTLPEVSVDAQFKALSGAGGVVTMPVGSLGDVPLIMSPLHMSATGVSARLPPPQLGEHTDEVLAALGYSVEEVTDLRAQGVVA